jgi:hypothetical protein
MYTSFKSSIYGVETSQSVPLFRQDNDTDYKSARIKNV